MFQKDLLVDAPAQFGSSSMHLKRYYYRGCSVVETHEQAGGKDTHLISFKLQDFQRCLNMDEVSGILGALGMNNKTPIIQYIQENVFTPGSTVYFLQYAA